MRKHIYTAILGLSIVAMVTACQQEQKPSDQNAPTTTSAAAPAPESTDQAANTVQSPSNTQTSQNDQQNPAMNAPTNAAPAATPATSN